LGVQLSDSHRRPSSLPSPHKISSDLLTRFHEDTRLHVPAYFIASSGHNRLALGELAIFSAALTIDCRWSLLQAPCNPVSRTAVTNSTSESSFRRMTTNRKYISRLYHLAFANLLHLCTLFVWCRV